MAATLSEVLGIDCYHNNISPAEFRALGFPGADDLGNMFQFNAEFADDFCARRNLDESRALNPQLQTFAAWLASNAARIPIG